MFGEMLRHGASHNAATPKQKSLEFVRDDSKACLTWMHEPSFPRSVFNYVGSKKCGHFFLHQRFIKPMVRIDKIIVI